MILVDTGPLVGLFDPADGAHAACVTALKEMTEPLVTTVPVLTEAFHLLDPATIGARNLGGFIEAGGLAVQFLNAVTLQRCFELMRKYADQLMDLADASLVTMAETEGAGKVFTLDRSDFATYRIRRGHRYVSFQVIDAADA